MQAATPSSSLMYINEKKYNYIYKTTCIVTGKFYVGMHSTNSLDDGYLGSGTVILRSIKKHGKNNHSLEILEHCSSRTELKQREKEIVNEQLLADPCCINIVQGGNASGWIFPNDGSTEHKARCSKGGKTTVLRNFHSPEARAKAAETRKKNNHFCYNSSISPLCSFTGKKHSEETKAKMRNSHAKRVNRVIDDYKEKFACVDFSKYGWTLVVSEIIDIDPKGVRTWMKRHFPEILITAFKGNKGIKFPKNNNALKISH